MKALMVQLIGAIAMTAIIVFTTLTACSPKKREAQPQIPTKESIDNENNPITLANWAFELIMQMEGRDENERDTAVAEALAAVYEKAGQLPEGGYTIFSREVERLYMGEPDSFSEQNEYIGSFGPAGGIIFYDKGNNENVSFGDDGWRFLETVPDGYEFTAIWGLGYRALDGLSTAIGTGKRNTEIIVHALKSAGSNTAEFDYYERYYKGKAAADMCVDLSINGYNDWFLPSIDELRMMYENIFKEHRTHHYAPYWSSSDDGDESTWFFNLDDGTQDTAHAGRDMAEYGVFAIRAFR
jgi:hypothetical protein